MSELQVDEDATHAGVATVAGVRLDPADVEKIGEVIRSHTNDRKALTTAVEMLEFSGMVRSSKRNDVVGLILYVLSLPQYRGTEEDLSFSVHATAVKVLEVCCDGWGIDQAVAGQMNACLFDLLAPYRDNHAAPMTEVLRTFNRCVKTGIYPRTGDDGGMEFFTLLVTTLTDLESSLNENSLQVAVSIYMNIARDSSGTNVRVDDLTIHEHTVRAGVDYLRRFGLPSLDNWQPDLPGALFPIKLPPSQHVLKDLSEVKYASKKAPFMNKTLLRSLVMVLGELLRHKYIFIAQLQGPALTALRRITIFDLGIKVATATGVGDLLSDIAPHALDMANAELVLETVQAFCQKNPGLCEDILRNGTLETIVKIPATNSYLFEAMFATLEVVYEGVQDSAVNRINFIDVTTPSTLSYLAEDYVNEWASISVESVASSFINRLFDDCDGET